LANQLSGELKFELIGIYAGGQKSGVMQGGVFRSLDRVTGRMKTSHLWAVQNQPL
jgi:hypothetical protein